MIKLKFINRTAAECCGGEDAEVIELEVSRASIKPIMAWYGAYYAGDDYDVRVNGRLVDMDQNGEFVVPTIEGASMAVARVKG